MYKYLMVSLSILAFMLAACTEKSTNKNDVSENSTSEVITASTGNWQVKESELSSQNKENIQSDLSGLNGIVNSMNSKAIALRNEIINAKNDKEKINQFLKSSQNIQESGLTDLMGLTLKSSEVQAVRIKMIDNLMLTQKMFELSNEPNFNIESPSAEFKSMSLKSQKLQLTIGKELDKLNNEFK